MVVGLAVVPVELVGVSRVHVVDSVVLVAVEDVPVDGDRLVGLGSGRSLHNGGGGLHHGDSSVEGRDGAISIGVVGGYSNSDLLSGNKAEGGEGSHRHSAGVDVNIATAELGERCTLTTSALGANLDVVSSDVSTTVSGAGPGDSDGAFNNADGDNRSLRLRSESDFQNLRLGASAQAGALHVESVESAASDGDLGRVTLDSSVKDVLTILFPVDLRTAEVVTFPGKVDGAAGVGEPDRLGEGRRAGREDDASGGAGGKAGLSVGHSVGHSEAVVRAEGTELSAAESAGVSELTEVIAARDSSPSSVGVNLDGAAGDSSGARSLVPGQNSSASDSSSLDGRSSGSRSSGVGSGLRPDTDVASSSADSEVDRQVAAVGASDVVQREAVGVSIVRCSSEANVLVLAVACAVLELISEGLSAGAHHGVPVHVNAVLGGIELNGRSGDNRSSLGNSEGEALRGD